METFVKKQIAIEHLLRGMVSADKKYIPALKAFEISKKYHSGLRKDGKTPEFNHQLNIVGSILNYKDLLIEPVNAIVAAFLHDVVEDYSFGSKVWDKGEERLKNLVPYGLDDLESQFGIASKKTNNCLSKVINGHKKSSEQYFAELPLDSVALVIKAEDRIDNLDSMMFVFSLNKQAEYAKQVYDDFIPALKEGEKNFPEQVHVYQMLKVRLKSVAKHVLDQHEIYKKMGVDTTKTLPEILNQYENESH